jgi:hypothetical protein
MIRSVGTEYDILVSQSSSASRSHSHSQSGMAIYSPQPNV